MESIEQKQQEYKSLTKNAKHTQQWKEYNEAQTKEKLIFYKLLDELLNLVPTRTYTFGRPRKSLRDMIFCCMIKIYSNTSSRRIISDLELAKRAGYIKDVPHFNTILNYFDDSGMKMVLDYLIGVSALPLKQVEKFFAIDSSGFGTGRFERWVDVRNKFGKAKRGYMKAHICCGVKTNIITSLQVTRGVVGDSTMFKALVEETSENFDMKEVSADKAYSSRDNLDLADSIGAQPYIPFRSNVKGKAKGSPTWAKLYKMYAENYLEFARHYHKRSNVESTFSMIKRKFGDFCRCRTERSQNNEIRCKVLAHNLVVLVHEIFELKLDVDFKRITKKHPAQKVV
ncbi:MAG: transposase [Nanoarchaeota archaeon]